MGSSPATQTRKNRMVKPFLLDHAVLFFYRNGLLRHYYDNSNQINILNKVHKAKARRCFFPFLCLYKKPLGSALPLYGRLTCQRHNSVLDSCFFYYTIITSSIVDTKNREPFIREPGFSLSIFLCQNAKILHQILMLEL